MKCSNFRRLCMETDRCMHLSHMHTYLYVRCVHIYMMYSGSQAVQLPVWIHDGRPAAVGEVPGHPG